MSKTAEEWYEEWMSKPGHEGRFLEFAKRIQSAARCEALENAAKECEKFANERIAVYCAEEIRALKSKPVGGK